MRSKTAPQIIRTGLCWVLFFVLCSKVALSQLPGPLPAQQIELKVDQQGRISNFPKGFVLQEHKLYSFHVTSAAQSRQHEQLLSFFKKQLNATYEKLSDPTDTSHTKYALLFDSNEKFAAYLAEIKELYDVLDQKDPKVVKDLLSKKSKDAFPHFHKRDFLMSALFGDLHQLTLTCNGKSVSTSGAFNAPVTAVTDTVGFDVDRVDLKIKVNDFCKQFIATYFNKSRELIKSQLDDMKVKTFYNESVKIQIPSLAKMRMLISGSKINDRSELAFICGVDSKSVGGFMMENALIKLLDGDWMLNVAWMTGGELRLNPLEFTDESLLDFATGFDQARADQYDEYVSTAIARMKDPKSSIPISPKKFDSLNRESSRGKELYRYDQQNAQLKKLNKMALIKAKGIRTTLDSLTFRVLDKKHSSKYFLRTYNTDSSLLIARDADVSALANDTRIELMAYNLRTDQSYSVTPVISPTNDGNKISGQLSEAANTLSSLAGNGVKAAPFFFSAARGLLSPKEVLTKVTISVPKVDAKSSSRNTGSEVRATFRLKTTHHRGKILVYLMNEKGEPEDEEVSISAHIEDALTKNDLDECSGLQEAVEKAALERIKPRVREFKDITRSEFDQRFQKVLDQYLDIIYDVIAEQLKVRAAALEQTLKKEFRLLAVAEFLLKNGDYTLPPKAYQAQDGIASAAYYNGFKDLGQQADSKRIELQLVLNNKISGKTSTRMDEFKVSPPHWITASMGIGYVFNKFSRSDVSVSNGVIVNTPDEDQVRLLAGIHLYPRPILLTDDRFITSMKLTEMLSRFSLFLGASFPRALYNPHVGITVEPWPSVKLTYGAHFYRKTTHKVINDQLAEQDAKYQYNSGFFSVTIEPLSLLKMLEIIK